MAVAALNGLLWALVGYVLGSFPSAYMGSRLFAGKDIREVGSGNVGGMNALRNASVPAGVFTAVFDVGKGALAVWLASSYAQVDWAPALAGAAAVVGHNWMLFLGFRGGKGLGATLGSLLVLQPVLALVFVGAMGLGAVLTRDTNVGAGLASLSLPLALGWAGGWAPAWVLAGLVYAAAILLKHRPDFAAYRAGRRRMV